MPSYDPYTHAHTLGVDIVWGTPGHGMLGRYDHASRTITLREGMRTRQERSVLAHETAVARRARRRARRLGLHSLQCTP